MYNNKTTYEIRAGKYEPCELVSVVKGKSWGGTADIEFTNVVCAGTHNYCMRIKDEMENME